VTQSPKPQSSKGLPRHTGKEKPRNKQHPLSRQHDQSITLQLQTNKKAKNVNVELHNIEHHISYLPAFLDTT
jgi:hypothetical protein